MTATIELPTWDMAVVYPGLDSPEFASDFSALRGSIEALVETFGRHGIDRTESLTVNDEVVAVFESIVQEYNGILDAFSTLQAYVYAFVSTDSRNDLAQARLSELEQQAVRAAQLGVRFTAWIGSLDVNALIERSEMAAEYAFLLRQASIEARHQMSPAEEELTTELTMTGGNAWGRLHENVTSQLMVDIEANGERPVPMTVVRNLAFDPNRSVREEAFNAELATWRSVAVPIAAALNSIKGETNTLAERRGWSEPLEAALFHNNIDQQTLDAMMSAAKASFPDFRRYLRAKARVLGLERLAFFDLFAPVVKTETTWEYPEARQFIVEQFSTYSDRLSSFAARAFDEHWIDAGPRPGKTGGAFCMPLRRDESRILANYLPSYDWMSTLAHELGHGYHNFVLADRPALQREHPMTLAETASIFCQTIVDRAARKDASPVDELAILESGLQDNCQVVVDITSRFLFEKAVLERRRQRELSVEEFNDLMLDAQQQTYGDGLDPAVLHPYMWAVKGHYYGSTFYNYPYMFGLLFGLGLYARYQADPDRFTSGYDDLLSSTGRADAATLAAQFGIDTRSESFWADSLSIIKGNVDRFEELVGEGVVNTPGGN